MGRIMRRCVTVVAAAALLVAGVASVGVAGPRAAAMESPKSDGPFIVVPDRPVGVVFVFHGTHSCARCFNAKPEVRQTLALLHRKGFATVVASSASRTGLQRWNVIDPPRDNADLQAMDEILQRLVKTTSVNTQTPIYALGFSNGAIFASLFLHHMASLGQPVGAAAMYGGRIARQIVRKGPTTPTIFVMSRNDDKVSNTDIQADERRLSRAHVANRIIELRERRLTARALRGVPGLTTRNKLVRARNLLLRTQIWNSRGRRIVAARVAARRIDQFVAAGFSSRTTYQLRSRARTVVALHGFSAQPRGSVVRFFERHR